MTQKLSDYFKPVVFNLIDESHAHRVAANAESHFKLIMVASCFQGQSLVHRQRSVYQQLENEWSCGLHALSMHLYTPEEWSKHSQILNSPACAHQRS